MRSGEGLAGLAVDLFLQKKGRVRESDLAKRRESGKLSEAPRRSTPLQFWEVSEV